MNLRLVISAAAAGVDQALPSTIRGSTCDARIVSRRTYSPSSAREFGWVWELHDKHRQLTESFRLEDVHDSQTSVGSLRDQVADPEFAAHERDDAEVFGVFAVYERKSAAREERSSKLAVVATRPNLTS